MPTFRTGAQILPNGPTKNRRGRTESTAARWEPSPEGGCLEGACMADRRCRFAHAIGARRAAPPLCPGVALYAAPRMRSRTSSRARDQEGSAGTDTLFVCLCGDSGAPWALASCRDGSGRLCLVTAFPGDSAARRSRRVLCLAALGHNRDCLPTSLLLADPDAVACLVPSSTPPGIVSWP
jgi:hypothetical protein